MLYIENKYWFCTSEYDAPRDSSTSQSGKFVCTATRYTRDQLLNAVIICDDGWQYRPERWPDATTLATTRPDNVSTPAALLNYGWWGTDTYFAMNISKVSGEVISSDYADAATHVRIYIPNDSVAQNDAELASTIDIDLSKYEALNYEYIENSYYNCKSSLVAGTASSSQSTYFICTAERYTKDELLNAIIICDSGWAYRPEKWPDADTKNTARSDEVTENIIIMNEEWWGDNTYCALNIRSEPKADISSDYGAAATHVRIYVPMG